MHKQALQVLKLVKQTDYEKKEHRQQEETAALRFLLYSPTEAAGSKAYPYHSPPIR
jgi:hypothetical protein